MTYEEMVRHLLKTYPPGDHRGDELMDYITAEIKAAEARGAITPEGRERVYRHFGITISEHGGPADSEPPPAGGCGRRSTRPRARGPHYVVMMSALLRRRSRPPRGAPGT